MLKLGILYKKKYFLTQIKNSSETVISFSLTFKVKIKVNTKYRQLI